MNSVFLPIYFLMLEWECKALFTSSYQTFIGPACHWLGSIYWVPAHLPSASSCHPSMHVKVKSSSRVRLFATPWTVAYQAPGPWDFTGKSTGVGCHFLLQGIFPTQGSKPGLLHCRQTLYRLSHQGSPINAWDAPKSQECHSLISLLMNHWNTLSSVFQILYWIFQILLSFFTEVRLFQFCRETFVSRLFHCLTVQLQTETHATVISLQMTSGFFEMSFSSSACKT